MNKCKYDNLFNISASWFIQQVTTVDSRVIFVKIKTILLQKKKKQIIKNINFIYLFLK